MPTRSSERKLISGCWTSCRTRRRLFPPHQTHPQLKWKNKGPQKVSHQTVNGVVQIRGRVYWNEQTGSLTPLDQWLGIADAGYSAGVREMACRLSLDHAFVPAAENLARLGQIALSSSALRELVEREGRRAQQTLALNAPAGRRRIAHGKPSSAGPTG